MFLACHVQKPPENYHKQLFLSFTFSKLARGEKKMQGQRKEKQNTERNQLGLSERKLRSNQKKDKLYSFHLSLHHLGDLISFHFFFFCSIKILFEIVNFGMKHK